MAKADTDNPGLKIKTAMNTHLKNEYLHMVSEVNILRRVKTDLLSLDEHTGGGLPMGVPISIQGRKSVGKSAFCYYMAGKAVEQYGGAAVLVQTEGGFVPAWAELCGLPPCDFVPIFEGDKLQETLELILQLLRTTTPTCVIFDSLSMLARDPDQSLLESESRGGRAKPINAFFRNLIAAMNPDNPPLFLYIEHLHQDVSSPYRTLVTTGGETKGYANVMEIRLSLDVPEKKDIETDVGKKTLPIKSKVVWEIYKSKASPAKGTGSYELGLRDTPWSKAGEITDFEELLARCINRGHVKKMGSWFQVGEEKYQGVEALKAGVGTSTLREIALRPRAESGTTNSFVKEVKKKATKRSRKSEGGHAGGEGAGAVSGGTQVGDGEVGVSEAGVAE